MNLKLNKHITLHYILLYIALSFQGSVIYKLYDAYFMMFAIFCTILFFIKYGWKKINTRYTLGAFLICGALLCNHFYTNGSTSIGTVGNFFSRFCIALLCVEFDKINFKERLLKLIVFIAGVNLIEFFLGLTPLRFVFRIFPALNSSGSIYNCSLFYAAKLSDMSRNNGMFGEPGVYQIILNVALVLLLFDNNPWLTLKRRKKYLFIILLSIITAQSTTGYLGTILVIMCYLFSSSKYNGKFWLKALILLGIVILIFIALFAGRESFIYERFISKLFVDGKLDLSASTGRYRAISIETDLKIAFQNLGGVGTESYKVWWNNYVHDWGNTNGSVVGLTRYCATYGIFITLLMLIFVVSGMHEYHNYCKWFSLLGILFVTILSQPHVIYVIYLMVIYSNLRGNNE